MAAAAPPKKFRGNEDVKLVDRSGVEQSAQHVAASFDQDVSQPAAAQFGQQGIEPRRGSLAVADEHLAAGGREAECDRRTMILAPRPPTPALRRRCGPIGCRC